MNTFFYEEIHRATNDIPYVDTQMTDLQYCAHYHEELELILMLEGEVLQTIDGKNCCLSKGDIAFIRPFQIHSYETPVHSCMYLFKIQSPIVDFSALCWEKSRITKEMTEYPALLHSIRQLIAEYSAEEDTPLKRLAVRCAADQLLLQLARLPGTKTITQDSILARDKDIALLKTINHYLAHHYQDNISLTDAAAACHMSMYYFAHSFKHATGTTFINYLNSYRLEHAKCHIIDTEDSVTKIAMQCGFPSIRTFNRCFQKHYKLTPTQARAKWKSENKI